MIQIAFPLFRAPWLHVDIEHTFAELKLTSWASTVNSWFLLQRPLSALNTCAMFVTCSYSTHMTTGTHASWEGQHGMPCYLYGVQFWCSMWTLQFRYSMLYPFVLNLSIDFAHEPKFGNGIRPGWRWAHRAPDHAGPVCLRLWFRGFSNRWKFILQPVRALAFWFRCQPACQYNWWRMSNWGKLVCSALRFETRT